MENKALKSLIEELKRDEIDGIKNLIKRKEAEQFFVDFKTSASCDYEDKKALDTKDRDNLSKAISGFGNSEGGLLIWGIDTSNKENRNDYAQGLRPINNPENFSSLINSSISRLTIPVHSEVENFIIKENSNSNKGFVITIIPKSYKTPHEVINTHKYYMRAGDSFVPIPYSVLAGMFGKRPSPDVIIMFTVSSDEEKIDGDSIKFSFGIHIANRGMGIARDIFLNYYIFGINEKIEIMSELKDSRFEGVKVFGMGMNLISSPSLRMASEQRLQPIVLRCKFEPPFSEDITIKIMAGSEGQPPSRFEVTTTKDELQKMYDDFMDNPSFNFAGRFLKLKTEQYYE